MAGETKRPKVSVITATYNRKDTLKRTIKSVLAQSFEDFEHIIVDDCSTQDIETLVKSFGDARLRYFRMEKNSGHDGPPKNRGIKESLGEYVCFLDDDDEYRVDALKMWVRYADESKVDLVYGDYLIDGKVGWSLDFSAQNLSKFNFIAQLVAFVRREALLKVGGFDEAVPKFKDWNLWLRLQKSGASFLHVPIIVAEIHTLPESISTKYGEERDAQGRYKPTYFNPADCLIYPAKTSLGARKPLKIAVYTLTMNRLEYTKKMVKAMSELAGYPFDWFVLDQGSTDGTQEWLKSLTRDQPIPPDKLDSEVKDWRERLAYRLYPQNVGLAKGWNNAAEWLKQEGKYDILVKVDNDAEMMSANWLSAMVEIFERNRRVILSPYVEGLDGSPGGVLRQRASGESPYMLLNDRLLGLVPNIGGIVFATPIELFDDWKFDELYEGNKDYILCKYAKRNGYTCFYMEEFRVWHIDGTKGQHAKFPEYFKGREDYAPPEEVEEKTPEGTPEEQPH